MAWYRLAGQDFSFSFPIPDLDEYKIDRSEPAVAPRLPVPFHMALSSQARGWVGDRWREVEVWEAPPGKLLKVEGGCDFYLSPDGQAITPLEVRGTAAFPNPGSLSDLDFQILLGPAIVLALAQRKVWCLHASAATFKDSLFIFLGESGQGKSTLAGYLTKQAGWRRLADDILPVTLAEAGLQARPYFPQLKLPMEAQPGFAFPETMPINHICLLTQAAPEEPPALKRVSPNIAAQILLGHTAGTRLLDAALLAQHLSFCSQAAPAAPIYHLKYPRRMDALPPIRLLLEDLC